VSTLEDLVAARLQMAMSLGWHIVVACLGIGFPALTLLAQGRAVRTGEREWSLLARRWAKALAVVFAVGAVSGTILSFELGVLWPGLMGTYGEVIGLPFAIEGIAFFIEAIFLGIYLYGWGRFPPRVHLFTGIPLVLAGVGSAFFVVTANAWMQQPAGFRLAGGRVVDASAWRAMFNRATPYMTVHMILAAFMVSGFLISAVYAAALLRGRRDVYTRRAFALSFAVAAIVTPVQIGVGDWAAHSVAHQQPIKLAAMEGVFRTERGAPLRLGGVVADEELRYAIEVPRGLSLLAYWDSEATVMGLQEVPEQRRPPVGILHLAFDIMVGVGFALLGLAVWFAIVTGRKRRLPSSPWFYRSAVLAGPAAVLALEAGWLVTEVGRQPWVVFGHQLTAEAVSPAPGLRFGFYGLVLVYLLLTLGLGYVLSRLARSPLEGPDEPQRRVSDYRVVRGPR
jgi:cytochrome d ubiquinol oxidase subunit I